MTKFVFAIGLALGAAAGYFTHWTSSQYRTYAEFGTCKQTYPNIPAKLLLENEKVVVQRFTFPPGQWEGVHAHPANQLYIHLTDAHWKVRYGDRIVTDKSEAGSVGWFGPVRIEDDHESINIGENPIELIWVTLKEDCNV